MRIAVAKNIPASMPIKIPHGAMLNLESSHNPKNTPPTMRMAIVTPTSVANPIESFITILFERSDSEVENYIALFKCVS